VQVNISKYLLTKNHKIVGGFGWYGMIAIVLAYALNYFDLLNTSNFWYAFLNISGSLGIIADSWYHEAWQSVVLNVIWVGIAIMALLKIFIR